MLLLLSLTACDADFWNVRYSNVDYDDTATTDDSATDDSGDSGDSGDTSDTEDTGEVPQFVISDPVFGGNTGAWDTEETLSLQLTLTNNGEDFMNYPGIRLVSDDPDLIESPEDNYLYGIFAGTSTPLNWTLEHDAGLAEGATVGFTATVIALNCDDCPDENPLEFTLTVGE